MVICELQLFPPRVTIYHQRDRREITRNEEWPAQGALVGRTIPTIRLAPLPCLDQKQSPDTNRPLVQPVA